MDMVDYQTAIIMFKAKNHKLPANIQSLFHDREGVTIYNLNTENKYYNEKLLCLNYRGNSVEQTE